MGDIYEKNVIVIGGSSGMGKEIAEKFYEEGYNVITISKSNGKKDINKNIKHFIVDISEYIAVSKFMSQVDKIDILVNCAGVINAYEEPDELLKSLQKYDTEDDWTFYCSDDELKNNINYFIESNKYFNSKFNEYQIRTYDISKNRERILDQIVNEFI